MENLTLLAEKRRTVSFIDSADYIASICNTNESFRAVLSARGTLLRCRDEETLWKCDVARIVACSNESGVKATHWKHVYYSAEIQSLICLSRNGPIVSVQIDSGKGELVGEFEDGIFASAWNGEMLLLVTSAEQDDGSRRTVILTMNCEWQVLAEVDLEEEHDLSQSVFVSIRPSDSSLCAVSSVDRVDGIRKVRFFKMDGLQLSALGRTEDGSGKLAPNIQATPLAWAGMGCSQLLATLQKKGKSKTQVAFFEPNGLRHGEFLLRDGYVEPEEVIALSWSSDSKLLALVFQQKNSPTSKIQLWHRRNYHWYLKTEIWSEKPLSMVSFHPENPALLIAATKGESWIEYEFNWHTSTIAWPCNALVVDGSTLNVTPLDRAVIPPPMAAASLNLPLPVTEIAIANQSLINTMAVLRLVDGSFVILKDVAPTGKTMSHWKPPSCTKPISFAHETHLVRESLRNLVIASSTAETIELVAAALTVEGTHCFVVLSISVSDLSITEEKLHYPEEEILTIAPWNNASGALLELVDGALLEYSNGALLQSVTEPFLEPCNWICAIKMVANSESQVVVGRTSKGRLYYQDVLLSESVSSFMISSQHEYLCFVSADSPYQLRFIHLSEIVSFDALMGSEEHERVLATGYEPRDIEHGSKLIAVDPRQAIAVLQMPRGNLEAIYPRALVLRDCMIKILAQHQYGEAFALMRRQKVNLNLLVDMDPDFFVSDGVRLLIDQLIKTDHLNLFISSLQNWNSTAVQHPVPSWIRNTDLKSQPFDFDSKVNIVCQSLRSTMMKAEEQGKTDGGREIQTGAFLLPILSTFAKEVPPRIEDALELIKSNAIRQSDTVPSNKPILFSDKAQSAIQYLAFMAEYELLFNRALGQYDYDMARAIARNSQMDPKVYIPLLKRYKEIPRYYARYEVDIRLQRYEAALRNLAQSLSSMESLEGIGKYSDEMSPAIGNTIEDCIQLIESKKLHRVGLELFPDPETSRRIMLALGDMMLDQKELHMALNVYLAASPVDIQRARTAAKACRDWETFFSLKRNGDGKFSAEHSAIEAREMVESLTFASESATGAEKRQLLSDAAKVLLDYAGDVSGSIDFLLRAELWKEAKRVAVLHSFDCRAIVEASKAFAQKTIQDLEERHQTFQETMERYQDVVAIRREAIASGEEENDGAVQGAVQDDNGSLFSTASTTMSNVSMKSTGSAASHQSSIISVRTSTSFSLSGADENHRHKSKFNQRGQQKKKSKKKKNYGKPHKVRPGSQAELVNLVGTLRSSCPDLFYATTVQDAISFLARHHELDLARSLLDCYNDLKIFIEARLTKQKETDDATRRDHDARIRRDGFDGRSFVTLEIEKEVFKLTAPQLASNVVDLFHYLPTEHINS